MIRLFNKFFMMAALPLLLLPYSSAAQHRKTTKKPVPTAVKIYAMSAAQSQLTITLTQEGLLRKRYPNHHVAVKNFSGQIQLPANETKTTVILQADAKSCTNTDTMKDFERNGFQKVLHNEVLASNHYPTITFRSVSITNIQKSDTNNRSFTLNGDLTLRGVTRRVALPVKVTINGNQLRAIGEETIKQSDFGITPVSGGFGAIKIGDQLKVSFTIIANLN